MAMDPGCCPGCGSCLLGLYGCQWAQGKERKGARATTVSSGESLAERPTCVSLAPAVQQRDRSCWFIFLFCVCLFVLVWLYHALIILNDFHNLNEFLFRQTQWWVDWSLPLLSVTALLLTYSALLLVLALCLQLWGQPLELHCLHKCLLILTALVVAAAFIALDMKWAVEWQSVRISLQATGPFLHIGAVAGVTLLAWPVASYVCRRHHAAPKICLLLLYLGVTAALYLAPLTISSPCIMEESHLPPKPALAGHRGAPMLAPENTLMSLRKAVECDVRVFETDVMVSADGVPFLMHDEKLTRTTNVREVFPTRVTMNGTAFNWTELQQLDAGSWFLQKRPFPTVQGLSLAEQSQVKQQKIPSLQQVLQELQQNNVSLMFDLRPENHTDYQSFINVTLETILQSGIHPQRILWLPDAFREQVKQQAPGFQQIYGQKRSQNESTSVQRVNLPYQDMGPEEIGQYRQDNVSINLYVVNEPWLFSVLWCAGASSVTTNACQVLKEMKRPLWLFPSSTYLMIWIVTDCVSFLLILWAFLLLQKCSRRKEPEGSDNDVLLMKINSLMQE